MSAIKFRKRVAGYQTETSYDVNITSTQLLALNATAIEVVPAPAAGFHLVPTGIAVYKPAGTAYGGIAAGEDLALRYTDKTGLQVASCEVTGFLDQVTAQFRWAYCYCAASGAGAGSDVVAVTASPLVLHMLVGEITTGNTALKVRTFYYIIPDAITPV